MRKNYWFIAIPLLISLFIYLFYRTEKTVVTELFIGAISVEIYAGLKNLVVSAFPLNEQIIYSVPEGLWVFCITLTSKNFFLTVGKRQINCVFAPLVVSIGLEICQLFHLANGRFDYWDMSSILLFWFIAVCVDKCQSVKQNILQPVNVNSFVCFLSYAIVYLAHVWE